MAQPREDLSPSRITPEDPQQSRKSSAADRVQSRHNAASRDRLNPSAPPGRRLEGIREILYLVHDLIVAELHNADCVCWSPLVGNCVFRDRDITFPENSVDVETRGLTPMMT